MRHCEWQATPNQCRETGGRGGGGSNIKLKHTHQQVNLVVQRLNLGILGVDLACKVGVLGIESGDLACKIGVLGIQSGNLACKIGNLGLQGGDLCLAVGCRERKVGEGGRCSDFKCVYVINNWFYKLSSEENPCTYPTHCTSQTLRHATASGQHYRTHIHVHTDPVNKLVQSIVH